MRCFRLAFLPQNQTLSKPSPLAREPIRFLLSTLENSMPKAPLRVACSLCGTHSVINEDISPSFSFLCVKCTPPPPEEACETLRPAKIQLADMPSIEGFGWDTRRGREWIAVGFQERKPRRPRKAIPAWVTDQKLCEEILRSHPQHETWGDDWAEMLRLHYRLQWSVPEVAHKLESTVCCVKNTLKKLRNRAAKHEVRIQAKADEIARASALYEDGASVRIVSTSMKISLGKASQLRGVHLKGLS